MRILTWNINGLSTTLHYHPWSETKSYENLFNALEANIICLQEIKCQRSRLTRDMAVVPGYDGYFSFSKTKLGYSGVAIYVKQPLQPKWTEEGITGVLNTSHTPHDDPEFQSFLTTSLSTDPKTLDAEGRCIIMDFNAFILFNIYFPNDGNEQRIDFKMDYHTCVRRRIDDYLKQGRQVILVGDINSVHEEIDHCDPKKSIKDHEIENFKDLPQRAWLDQLLVPKGPLVDICRQYHPGRRGMFTCWNTRLNARPSNYGTRIDYILPSTGLEKWFKDSNIRPDIMGSDHCPVYVDFHDQIQDTQNESPVYLKDKMKSDSIEYSLLFARNFDEFSDKQKKLSSWFGKGSATTTATTPSTNAITATAIAASSSPTTMTSMQQQLPQKPIVISPLTSSISKKRKASTQQLSPGKGQKLLKSYFDGGSGNSNSKTKETCISSSSTESTDISDGSKEEEEDIDMESLMNEVKERQDTKQNWSSLFTPRAAPLCRLHQEPCKMMTVTKKGPNQGRKFYVCARPFGSNEDSTTKEYQCDFFQWKHESNAMKPK
ncbi:Endonuclease/exonuclease/phosphatase [Phascolomyces articulosus]|uniref:DNA-(apurinic or apyrimidinic site) endonuclease n=1 Tax=Phascolomyces articulosus TaxID=60185 RepID=A0AAD5JW31_9FUNG|nr:Endonuclease/exonuclease/phosphatase [Phascolomyces articulosus]